MLTTTNYKFKKPELTDSPPDITVTNSNWDTVDTNLKDAQTKANTWNTFRTKGGNITGDLNLVKSGITSHFGYSAFTSVASCWTVKGGTITTPIGLNLAAEPGQWSALLPIKDNEMKLGNEHYRYSDIFVGNFSKSDNGYTKLPNGLILQWGIINVEFQNGNISTISTVQLPITFPSNVVYVGTEAAQISPSGIPLAKITTGNSDCRTNLFNVQAFSIAGELKHTVAIKWIAIGY